MTYNPKYSWEVCFTNKAAKQVKKLNLDVLAVLRLLVEDLTIKGPWLENSWPNYGKLASKKNESIYHCHLIKGKPTYVCCWELIDKKLKIIEVCYVGTHENAPY